MQTYRRIRISFFMLVLAIVLLAMARPASAEDKEPADVVVKVVVVDLDAPTDFSVTADGEVVFIAEQGARQIRRLQGDVNEIVVSGIEAAGQSAESIAVHAISPHQVLVGVSGFSSAKQSLCLFDVSAEELPLGFVDQHVKHSRSYERLLKRTKAFNVFRFLGEQRGLSMVCQIGEAPPTLFDIRFKARNLEKLAEHKFEEDIANLSTLAVDQMGGYLVALTQDKPSQLLFYRAEKTLMQSFPIDLENIVSMSFSPIHNRLFALVSNANDDDTNDAGGDGIYEILTDGDTCKSRFVTAIERPETLKFDEQGGAWVLCRSEPDSSRGFLVKVKNLDVSPAIPHAKREGANED